MGEACLHGQRWCCCMWVCRVVLVLPNAEQVPIMQRAAGLDAVHRTDAGDQHAGVRDEWIEDRCSSVGIWSTTVTGVGGWLG